MKVKNVFLTTVLAIALTLPMFGQHNRRDTTKADMKKHDISRMMGKPTVDANVEGLHMKVWLMTQKQHKKMMKGKMGQMMMHGKKEGAMEPMGMSEMKDTSMVMGKDMKGMKHEGMPMNKALMDSMMSGTHNIMLDVKDSASGKEIADASASVLIVSPSKKTTSVDLKPMMNHYGGALKLDEKGEYQFTVSVIVGGVSRTKLFQYMVK